MDLPVTITRARVPSFSSIPRCSSRTLTSPGRTAPHYNAGRLELKASIEEAVNKLPSHYREPFLLREHEQMSYEEIAEVLGVRLGTVKSRINRARASLRESLKDVWEEWK